MLVNATIFTPSSGDHILFYFIVIITLKLTTSSPSYHMSYYDIVIIRGDSSDRLNDGGGFEDEVGRILWQVRRKYKNTQ